METLLANLANRTVKGLLLPYGEVSRPSNIGPVMFERGTVAVPTDPMVVGANIRHKREQPVGRAIELEDTAAGIVATFSIANTAEGDQLLRDVSEGRLTRLSAEVRDLVRSATDKTRAVSSALFGGAFVDEGAFASATLYAELATPATIESQSHTSEEYTDSEGVTWIRKYDSETTSKETDNGVTTTTVTTVTEETSEADAEEEEPKEETMDAEVATTPDTTPATVPAGAPATLLAGARPKATTALVGASLYQVANALALFSRTGDASQIEALSELDRSAGELMFAALSDIKISTGVGANIQQPQWIGDVWAARTYARKYVPLIGGAPLTSFKIKGFKFGTKPAGGDWDGDKADVPSNTPTTSAVDVTASRFAGGHDIAREYVDFDVPEFWVSYFQYMANSYSKWADAKALAGLVAGATAVTAGAVPAGINEATVSLVDGALAVIATEEATPSFALAATDVYRDLLLQTKDDILATLSLATGLESAEFAGFRIIPSASIAATKVLVGARDAATFYELPGSPIRTEALDLAKGGVDKAIFGYAGVVINNPAALALVTPAA